MKNLTIFVFVLLLLPYSLVQAKESNTTESCVEQSYLKTALEITYPNSSTVWTAPSTVKLEWITKNIPSNKTIKFYLSKDDMVVQELGIFNNSNFVYEIQLDRGLATGDNYRVFGIELFPEDKFSIAKYATTTFTINKAPREVKVVEEPVLEEKPQIRENFDGRTINYVNELNVASENISISLWDHGRKDGDVVSIYLNGEAIVSKYLLEYQKKVYEIKLDPAKANDLFLYAHNLGKFPPNTVSIEINDGEVSENIVLNSDLKSCEAVLINVKK
jgi:hypothetical protein